MTIALSITTPAKPIPACVDIGIKDKLICVINVRDSGRTVVLIDSVLHLNISRGIHGDVGRSHIGGNRRRLFGQNNLLLSLLNAIFETPRKKGHET